MELLNEAERERRAGVAIMQSLVNKFPTRSEYRYHLATSYSLLTEILEKLERWREVEEIQRKALPVFKQLANDFPNKPAYHKGVAQSLRSIAEASKVKDPEGARRLIDEALSHLNVAMQLDPTNLEYFACYALTYATLGNILLELRDHAGACAAFKILEGHAHVSADFYQLVGGYCACALLADKDPKLASQERQRLFNDHCSLAVKTLQRAVQLGYNDLEQLKTDKNLDPLRARSDLQHIVASLEEQKKGKQ
jgi:tetratricopeptide (TPR) repeat protein